MADRKGRAPETVRDIMAPGDIIRARLHDDGSWRLGQMPEVEAALVALVGAGTAWVIAASTAIAGGVLHMSDTGRRWVPLATYEVTANQLFFVYTDGDRKLWNRQR